MTKNMDTGNDKAHILFQIEFDPFSLDSSDASLSTEKWSFKHEMGSHTDSQSNEKNGKIDHKLLISLALNTLD